MPVVQHSILSDLKRHAMKKIIVRFYFSCLIVSTTHAQVLPNADPIENIPFPSRKKLHFYYDHNGNRIKRTLRVVYCDVPEEGDGIDFPPEEEITGPGYHPKQKSAMVNMGVNVFPNPTKELLHVTINSETDFQSGWLALYDLHGKEIYRKSNLMNASLEMISLERLSTGTYILKLCLNQQVFQYKIIKEN